MRTTIRKICFRVLHTIIEVAVLICLPFFWFPIYLWDNTGLVEFYKETFEYFCGDKPWGPLDGCFNTQRD
jgi:hypothetical protein